MDSVRLGRSRTAEGKFVGEPTTSLTPSRRANSIFSNLAPARWLRESLIAVLLVLAPASAGAQTPWSNVSSEGARVGPAAKRDDSLRISLRMDGGYSTASMPVRADATGSATENLPETRRTALMAGSAAINGLEIFLSSIAWDSQVGTAPRADNTSGSTVREGRIYKQWGDIAAGFRYSGVSIGPDDAVRLSFEGGAQFFGKNASEKQKNGCCPGVSGDATSLFTRARASWGDANDGLSVSATGGVLYDRTSNIWEELKTDLARTEKEPYEEERRAFGIYGNNGMLRVLGGAGVGYGINRTVGLFGETSFELNETELAVRLTPGVRITPLKQKAALLVYADVNPVGTKQKLSPAEPPLRMNVGMAYTFGGAGEGGSTRPRIRSPRPIVVTVEDSRGASVADALLHVSDVRKPAVIEQARTNEKGQAQVDVTKFGPNPNLQVKVASARVGYVPPPHPIELNAQRKIVVPLLDDMASEIRLTFLDANQAPFSQPLRVALVPPPATAGYRVLRFIVANGQLMTRLLPAGEWRVDVEWDGPTGKQTATRTVRLTAPRHAENIPLGFGGTVAIATPTPRPPETPRPAAEQQRFTVFETDLAQVRPAEVKRVAAALKNGGKTMKVYVKEGGDSLFLETLLKARCEALAAALKNEATGGSVPNCEPKVGTHDDVVVE